MDVRDFYFASFVAWMLHPGWSKPDAFNRRGAVGLPSIEEIEELARLVELVLEVRSRTWPELQQQPSPQGPLSPDQE